MCRHSFVFHQYKVALLESTQTFVVIKFVSSQQKICAQLKRNTGLGHDIIKYRGENSMKFTKC